MPSPAISLTFRLELRSDYHVGSGHRAGPLLDSALLRDYDHAPVLRGTMVVGLLRDGLEDLREQPPMKHIDFNDAHQRLFGTPERRKRWAFSSARPIGGIEGKAQRWGAQDATRVRINPRTRRSEPQKLFSEEEGDGRLVFEFTAICPSASAQDIRDATLLVAAARMVYHLGAARRRGRGECSIYLSKTNGIPALDGEDDLTDRALNVFKTDWLDGSSPKPNRNGEPTPVASLSTQGARRRFRILARLDEPTIIARRSEATNAYESLSWIPGPTLLGAIADRASAALQLEAGHEPPADFVTLFFRGGIRVSGLLPALHIDQTLYPSIPAPQALFTCENYPGFSDSSHSVRHPVEDFATRTGMPGKCTAEGCLAKLEPLNGFLALKFPPEAIQPARREEAHIQMKRETGRAKTGILFEYIALDAGQWFVGEMDCAYDEYWKRLSEWTGWNENTTFTLRLGKASRRGYGLTSLVLQPLGENDSLPWISRTPAERVTQSAPLTLTLLTDTIIPDAWGRFYAGFDAAWIARELGIPNSEVALLGNFAGARSVDTFNGYRRIPRWRDEAIMAGSAAGFRITDAGITMIEKQQRAAKKNQGAVPLSPLDALRWKLAQIEQAGIGLRRHEGFGRVAFNHPIYAAPNDWRGIALDLPADFTRASRAHELQDEMAFRRVWTERLKNGEGDHVSARFEPVARLLYLSRRDSLDLVMQRMQEFAAPSPEFLWKKSISARGKDSKIDSKGIEAIVTMIDGLGKTPNLTAQKQRIGLELLADWVAVQAAKKRQS